MSAVTLAGAAEYLKSHDNFLILSHRRPDGDTVGSCAALCRALRALGKQAWIYPNPQFTPKFAPFFNTGDGSPSTGDGSLCCPTQRTVPCATVPCAGTVVSCDIADRSLFPFGAEALQVDLALDHHGTNSGFAARTHADETKAACGALLVDLIPMLGVTMDRPMAEALYLAISTDTGCFRYSNVTENTFRCAAACVAAGAEIYPINRVFFETKRRARLKLEARLIEEIFSGGMSLRDAQNELVLKGEKKNAVKQAALNLKKLFEV
jgi:phosphoesterase RecJ-like protein